MTLWKRKSLVATALLVTLVPELFLPGAQEERARAGRRKPPNVLIIVTDDQRGGLEAMPALRRRFIQGGRRYPNFFATTPQCCPSRASILTGKYTHNHGVNNNDASQNLDPRTTLQYYLQRAGYRTALFGKLLNNWDHRLSPPYFNKWAIFDKGPGQPENPYFDAKYNVDGDTKIIDGYTTDVLGRLAATFIRQSDSNRDGRPWMAYVAPTAPHSPYLAERRYEDDRFGSWKGNPAVDEKDRSDKPAFVQSRNATLAGGARRRTDQLRTLRSVDDMIVKLLRTLRATGERNTLAIFVSDNGMLWGEHGLLTKNIPYQQSVNVPLMVRWPGRIERHSADRRLTGNVDITPTVLDAAGLSPRGAQFDGKSLLDDTWTRDRILLEFFGPALSGAIPEWAATRTHEHQYTEYYDENGDVTFREYYDLVNDPWELENHYEDDDPLNDPTLVEEQAMHDQLAADRGCAQETCP